MRSNDLCHIQCYTGHASTAMHPTLEGQFGPTEWIIRRITHKRKSGNLLIIFREMNKFSYLILHVLHDYNVGISWLRLEDVTPITCPTLVGRRDSSQKMWLWSYVRLRSYARLRLEDVTPVVCLTPIERYDSSHISQLRSPFPTLVDIMTPVISPDSSRASWLRLKSVPHVLPTHLWKTTHGWVRWLKHHTAQTLSQNQIE
jgi:hypothetical protein